MLLTVKSFACYAKGSDSYNHIYNVSLNDVTLQRDAPAGSPVLRQSVPTGRSSNTVMAHCYNGDKGHFLLKGGGVVKVSGYENVYQTNVQGIGIKIQAGTASNYYSNPSSDMISNGEWDWSWSNWGSSFDITLVKTGTVISGDIRGLTAVMSLDGVGDLLTLNITSGKVTGLACSINTPIRNAPLGNVEVTGFTGVGSTPKSYDFGVVLECDTDANINVSLEGVQSNETTNTSVLALTDAGQQNVASGVGVQILFENNPLKLNENIVIGRAGWRDTLLRFTARYIQTKTTVKTGAANATATLNLTYQ